MVAIGFTLLGIGLAVGALLALADPVLLSRINGEHAEGSSGRFIKADVVRLPARRGEDRQEPRAA
ncbi:hypothetical protein FE391_02175 [Nonomuraea sp. KC401]|uniref:hypothetical protein n=1 Tax=unclassified Nonomuraea TaxID=2593643 RepID=UPI0010FCF01E|nr:MULTISPECIES: hypothetical protein [unclassified Nonomuraea]NBE93625.1 hypothetical protein [Nonomuraea sp. K271]TLF85246.1 hypothetical protein FE391_02175 [Nonomuraea sp. KC401]